MWYVICGDIMNIEIGEYLTLTDGIEYVVTSKANYNDKTYYSLMDIKNNENIRICTKENKKLIFITDEDIELLRKLYEESKKYIRET